MQKLLFNFIFNLRYTGVCDPESPDMVAWFKKKRWLKRLQAYGKMMVN